MKIAVIDTGLNGALTGAATVFLPALLKGLTGKGDKVHLITNGENVSREVEESGAIRHADIWHENDSAEENTPVLARFLNELNPDVYLIWATAGAGWQVLPLLDPQIATIAVGHQDAEIFYAPARHYRPFLTRLVGATPETSVGFVINCVIDKERVEWISYDEAENLAKTIETYRFCFENAIEDAHAAPRQISADFPPMKTRHPARRSWLAKLRAKIMN